ncbi:MAG: hypothetical protein JWQ43_2777, partial [Glaciihabitans sp.]|nr:hypothetical protein [Glaciihabitans sp.]
EQIVHPQPLQELLDEAFSTYSATQAWVADFELHPKSVVRDMFERAMTFADYTGYYKLARSEGLVLRYLSDAYRAARQTIPDEAKTEDLLDIIEWLGELVRQVDSSLLDEWEALTHPTEDASGAPVLPPTPPGVTGNPRAFRVLVRNEMFRRVQLAALEKYEELGELDAAAGFDADAWADALDDYFDLHNDIGTHADARGSAMLIIEEGRQEWKVRQIFADPAGDHDWGISATVDLAESDEQGIAVVRVTSIGAL